MGWEEAHRSGGTPAKLCGFQPVSENYDDESILAFEWDSEKNESNLAKHGLDFEDVSRIFYG